MRIIKFLFMLAAIVPFIGCEKTEKPSNTPDRVGISRVTYFPTFNMTGEKYISIVKGGTFTDPGVTAKEGATDLQVQKTGTVDVNTVGVYDIVYSATNKDGFSSSITRTIAVLPVAEQPGANIAGKYANTGSFSYVATMQKLAPGFYLVDNIWGGGSAAIIAAYVISVDGQNLLLPISTLSPYGRVRGTGTLDAAGNLTYIVDLMDLGINGSTRKWRKQ
ncbi:MAG TPA: DUF5011 domain-containing protein [Chitinophagaceae bacterium]